jgi:DNA-directed RNA polymerase specialized sigma24 family protein
MQRRNMHIDSAVTRPEVGLFATTHWSVVMQAGAEESLEARQALEKLCCSYWYPLYAYVRRQGHGFQEAQDLTQEFFTRLLAKKYLCLADPARGKFRSFLLTSLKHFLINEWEKTRAAKRGGAQSFPPVAWEDAENRYLAEPARDLTPDQLFDKRWAVTIVEQAQHRLREEYGAANKLPLFEQLQGHVWGDGAIGYAESADRLNTTKGALRIAAHRMKERFRDLLREEVAHTAASADQVDAELRYLVSVLRT